MDQEKRETARSLGLERYLKFFQEHPRSIPMKVTALLARPQPLPASSRSVLPSNQYLFRYILALEFSERAKNMEYT